METEFESYKEDLLLQLKEVIEDVKDNLDDEVSDNTQQEDMKNKALDEVKNLENTLFEDKSVYLKYDSIIDCISEQVKLFRNAFPNDIGYEILNNINENRNDLFNSIYLGMLGEITGSPVSEKDELAYKKYKLAEKFIIKK